MDNSYRSDVQAAYIVGLEEMEVHQLQDLEILEEEEDPIAGVVAHSGWVEHPAIASEDEDKQLCRVNTSSPKKPKKVST